MKGCRSCRSWQAYEVYLEREDPATNHLKVQMGVCRRYAPHPAVTGAASGELAAEAIWPSVPSDAWCNEWEPRVL